MKISKELMVGRYLGLGLVIAGKHINEIDEVKVTKK